MLRRHVIALRAAAMALVDVADVDLVLVLGASPRDLAHVIALLGVVR